VQQLENNNYMIYAYEDPTVFGSIASTLCMMCFGEELDFQTFFKLTESSFSIKKCRKKHEEMWQQTPRWKPEKN